MVSTGPANLILQLLELKALRGVGTISGNYAPTYLLGGIKSSIVSIELGIKNTKSHQCILVKVYAAFPSIRKGYNINLCK